MHGSFFAAGAGNHDQRRGATPRDQYLQCRVGREPRQVEVAQDDVEVVLHRLGEAAGVLHALQKVAPAWVGPLQRQAEELHVVGIVFHAQQPDRGGFGGLGHGF